MFAFSSAILRSRTTFFLTSLYVQFLVIFDFDCFCKNLNLDIDHWKTFKFKDLMKKTNEPAGSNTFLGILNANGKTNKEICIKKHAMKCINNEQCSAHSSEIRIIFKQP